MENQHYITKWVEENLIGEVNDTHWGSTLNQLFVDNTVQTGVKYILTTPLLKESLINEIIQTGVKETNSLLLLISAKTAS